MRILVLLSLATLLAAVPTAAAQEFTVSITGAPAEFPTMESNATGTAAFQVKVTMSGAACPNGASIPVTLDVQTGGAPAFFTVLADPEQPSISVPQGAYTGAPGPTFSGSADVSLVATTTEITDNASIPVTVTATAQPPAECQTQGLSQASSEPVTIYANLTAPEPPAEPPAPPEDGSFLPGFGAVHGTVAALAAVALRRSLPRRK